MNILKEITAFIGWLSGSLAGIAAILYACGYLITRAHLHLLGVGAFLAYSREQYMQEGAKFFVDMANLAGRVSLPLLIVAILLTAVYAILRLTRLRTLLDRGKEWLIRMKETRPWLWHGILFAILLALLIYLAENELNGFGAPLAVSDLLFTTNTDPTAAETGEMAHIRSWLITGDWASLDDLFFTLSLSVMKAGVIFLLAWRVTAIWRLRLFLVSPFAVTFMLYLLLLPMVYGILKRPARFARITVDSDNRMLAGKGSELYLLDRNEHEFVLWDSTGRRVVWLPRGEVKSAEIGRSRFIFGKDN